MSGHLILKTRYPYQNLRLSNAEHQPNISLAPAAYPGHIRRIFGCKGMLFLLQESNMHPINYGLEPDMLWVKCNHSATGGHWKGMDSDNHIFWLQFFEHAAKNKNSYYSSVNNLINQVVWNSHGRFSLVFVFLEHAFKVQV